MLQYDNEDSHGWSAKALKVDSTKQYRKPSSVVNTVDQSRLNDLNARKPNVVYGPTDTEVIDIDVDGKKFSFSPFEFEFFARAVDEKAMYQYRASKCCKKIQFFEKKVKFEPIELALHAEFYDQLYTGPFISNSLYPSVIGMVVNGEKFGVGSESKSGSYELTCSFPNCNAKLYKTMRQGEIYFHFVPHSAEWAHSHSSVPAPPPRELRKVSENTVSKNITVPPLNLKTLKNSDYSKVFVNKSYDVNGKTAHVLYEEDTKFHYLYKKEVKTIKGKRWRCSFHRHRKCPAGAYSKWCVVDGVRKEMVAFDHVSVHNHSPIINP